MCRSLDSRIQSAFTIACMNSRHIQSGDELRCPHCRKWHPLIQRRATGTHVTVRMLYFVCEESLYFGGFVGAGSRHETRKAGAE